MNDDRRRTIQRQILKESLASMQKAGDFLRELKRIDRAFNDQVWLARAKEEDWAGGLDSRRDANPDRRPG